MSEEPKKPAETPSDQETDTAPGEESQKTGKTFSQDEVDALIQARVAKAKRSEGNKVRKEFEAKMEAKPEVKEEPPKGSNGTSDHISREEFESFKRSAELDKGFEVAIAGVELDDKTKELLREAYDKPGVFNLLLSTLKGESASKGDYKSPGGVSPASPETLIGDATTWSGEHVAKLVKDGDLLAEVRKYRDGLSGGDSGLFRKRIPKP